MPIPRISLQATVGALVALTAVSATAQTRPAPPPVRNVTDTYFGVTVNDPYRYFEDLKNPEVAAWMKGQAAYTTSVLAKIPHRDELLKEIQVRGDAVSARISGVQVVGPKVYYEKRLATENIFSLYVREGFKGKERLLINPDAVKSPNGEHSAINYYAPSPDQQVSWPMEFPSVVPSKA